MKKLVSFLLLLCLSACSPAQPPGFTFTETNDFIRKLEYDFGQHLPFYGEYISKDEIVVLTSLKGWTGEGLEKRVERINLKTRTVEVLYEGNFSNEPYQLSIEKMGNGGLRIDSRSETILIDKDKNSSVIRYPIEFFACVLLKDNETLAYVQDDFFGLYNTKTKENTKLLTLAVEDGSYNNFIMVNEAETKAVYTRINRNETDDTFVIDLVNNTVEKLKDTGALAYVMGDQVILRDNGNYDPDLNGSIRILDSDLTEQVRLENSGAEILDSAKGVLLYETKNKAKVSDPIYRLSQAILNVYDGKETIHLKDEIERVVTIISAKFNENADEMVVVLGQKQPTDLDVQLFIIKR